MLMTSWRNGKSSDHFSSLTLLSHFESTLSNVERDLEEVKNNKNTSKIILATVFGKEENEQLARYSLFTYKAFPHECKSFYWFSTLENIYFKIAGGDGAGVTHKP